MKWVIDHENKVVWMKGSTSKLTAKEFVYLSKLERKGYVVQYSLNLK